MITSNPGVMECTFCIIKWYPISQILIYATCYPICGARKNYFKFVMSFDSFPHIYWGLQFEKTFCSKQKGLYYTYYFEKSSTILNITVWLTLFFYLFKSRVLDQVDALSFLFRLSFSSLGKVNVQLRISKLAEICFKNVPGWIQSGKNRHTTRKAVRGGGGGGNIC